MSAIQRFDNRCVLSDYVLAVQNMGLSTASGAALIGYLWNNSQGIRPKGLANSVNKDVHMGSPVLAMQDAIQDACDFQWNRRDVDYKNFHYVLDTNRPLGFRLRKCFS